MEGVSSMPTEKEKMLAGELYDPSTKELVDLRTKAHSLCARFNATPEMMCSSARMYPFSPHSTL